ncbi:MAG: photosystem I reaction center subunit PsaK [Moorea sp. SIO3I7]|uniref:photosystem I reaction center subunit PsaK n=1 Tax=unclassified Moorena TaxID=2683338 RepID=UPI0013BB8E72|nr:MULTISPECIES: photosystem I reaction center subunit PsaK [unclassified Moorena]NEN96939.1 photosystem I reaction center subunit PsaK [Moorena sp. SIO3I7]NEO07749.1 photosystem I reaction center subunit PsaK [Moorena sp. SIO3I8]NEO35184.1 photosystem I reaction center subunit PsaK [Moorena sp. SIOASIH]
MGETALINSIFLAAVETSVPVTPEWSPTVGIVMILCNLFAITVGRFAIKNPGQGPALPGASGLFANFGIPELLATTSLGHILGAGVILGLATSGVL